MLTKRAKLQDWLFDRDRIPPTVELVWVATTKACPFANLGDALSPIIVSTLSGLPVIHRKFAARRERIACVGTIGQELKNGVVHLWGTGIDAVVNPLDRKLKYYQHPPNTHFQIHALRGLLSAQTFQKQGVIVPEVYGDPVWFLPSLIPSAPKKQYELGIVVHLSELVELTSTSSIKPEWTRYRIPPSLTNSIRIITTLTPPTTAAIEQKVKEITACKRIMSTSLHGLVIAEAYKIPCVYFQARDKGTHFLPFDDERSPINHRIRDFYSGIGVKQLFTYGQRLKQATPWEQAIAAIDQYWQPVDWSPDRFLETFPLPLAFNPLWDRIVERSYWHQIKF